MHKDLRRYCKWTNGKKTISGWYYYNWASDTFTVKVNRGKVRYIKNDKPEWDNWKLL